MEATTELQELPGVGPATADKLRENGYDTYQSLAVASPGELSNSAGVGESSAHDIVQAAREAADLGQFTTGTELRERRRERGRLAWDVPEVDDLLGGGVEPGTITEVYGEFGSGKTQVAHQLAVNVQLPPEFGGLGGAAVYLDTEDSFRPSRIAEIVRGLPTDARAAAMDTHGVEGAPDDPATVDRLVEAILDGIKVAKAFNSDHQLLLAERAEELAADSGEAGDTAPADAADAFPVRLVIIDSLTAHFRAEYVGRGQLAERQQKLNGHLQDLARAATLHDLAVLVTNQVQSNPDAFFGDPTRPIGGNVLGHAANCRLYLRPAKGDKRIVRLVDAPDRPEGEAVVRIEEGGLAPE